MHTHWNNSPQIDMSPHSDTLSWFRNNQSLLFLLNAVCLAEKQQLQILLYLVWPDRGSNPWSTALAVSTQTITLPMWLFISNVNSDREDVAYIYQPHLYGVFKPRKLYSTIFYIVCICITILLKIIFINTRRTKQFILNWALYFRKLDKWQKTFQNVYKTLPLAKGLKIQKG